MPQIGVAFSISLSLLLVCNVYEQSSLQNELSCDNGWFQFKEKCFYAGTDPIVNGDNEQLCSEMNSTMVSIHSAEENRFLKTFTTENVFYWLGGYRKGELFSRHFYWKDGSRFNFVMWRSNQPNQLHQENAVCMSVYTGDTPRWFDDVCHLTRFPLCQKYAKTRITTQHVEPNNEASQNLTSMISEAINNKLVDFEIKLSSLQTEMKKLAKSMDEKFHNIQRDITSLKSTMNKSSEKNKKQTDEKIDQTITTNDAAKKNEEKVYEQVDEKIDDIYYFIESIANNFLEIINDQVSFRKGGPKNNAIVKEANDITYNLCMVKNDKEENITKCYYFEKFAFTFEEASKLCKQQKANLVSIQDVDENNYLKGNMLVDQNYWTAGIRILPNTNQFAWENGEPFEFTRWSQSEPKNQSDANCIYTRHAYWFAGDCNEKFSVICEKTQASKDYLNREHGTELINKHSADITNAANNLTNLMEKFEKMSSRDAKFVMALQKVIDRDSSLKLDFKKEKRIKQVD